MTTKEPKSKRGVFLRLSRYVLQQWPLFLLALALTLGSNQLSLLGPRYSGAAIDAIELETGVDFPAVWGNIARMLGCYVISAGLAYTLGVVMIRLSQRIIYKMRKQVFEKLMTLPVHFFDTHATGDIISHLSYDIDTINATLSHDLVQILTSAYTVVGSLLFMWRISRPMILIFCLTVPVSLLFTRYRSRKESEDLHVLTAKGALLDGLSNCVGYAKTLMLLYRTAGIPCGYVHGSTGTNRSGTPTHAWNIACIDGKYTLIDATWSDQDKAGYVTHFYYGLSDDQMAGDHQLSSEAKLPACTDHVNWHRLHGCYVRTQEEACTMLRSHLRKGDKLISLRFADDAVYQTIGRDIPAFIRACNAASKAGERLNCAYSYAQEDSQRCLIINLLPRDA